MGFVQVEKTYSQQSFFDFLQIQGIKELLPSHDWPRGLMDKASDIGLEDLGFESLRGRSLFRHKTKRMLCSQKCSQIFQVESFILTSFGVFYCGLEKTKTFVFFLCVSLCMCTQHILCSQQGQCYMSYYNLLQILTFARKHLLHFSSFNT